MLDFEVRLVKRKIVFESKSEMPLPATSITYFTSNMDGFGGCGMRKNQIAEAKASQLLAISCGCSSSTVALSNINVEN